MKTTILGLEEIRQIVHRVGLHAVMDETIARLRRALGEYDSHIMQIPVRGGFSYGHPTLGLLEWMPVLEVGKHATIKIVGYHPANPTRHQLPTILSSIGIYDTGTGHLSGLIDGNFITAVRTGAASAVASQVLASPSTRTLGLIGCGAQAVTQFHALTRLFEFADVLVYDRDATVGEDFSRRVSGLTNKVPPVRVCSIANVVTNADILCTQTSVGTGEGPIFHGDDVRPWIHVNAVGSDFPGKTELPLSLLTRSLVVPDFPEQALTEGECQQLAGLDGVHIGPSLAELIQNADRYRDARDQPTVFDSTGFALEDHVAAEMMLEFAAELGLGQSLDIETIAADALDPYSFAAPASAAQHGLRANAIKAGPQIVRIGSTD